MTTEGEGTEVVDECEYFKLIIHTKLSLNPNTDIIYKKVLSEFLKKIKHASANLGLLSPTRYSLMCTRFWNMALGFVLLTKSISEVRKWYPVRSPGVKWAFQAFQGFFFFGHVVLSFFLVFLSYSLPIAMNCCIFFLSLEWVLYIYIGCGHICLEQSCGIIKSHRRVKSLKRAFCLSRFSKWSSSRWIQKDTQEGWEQSRKENKKEERQLSSNQCLLELAKIFENPHFEKNGGSYFLFGTKTYGSMNVSIWKFATSNATCNTCLEWDD